MSWTKAKTAIVSVVVAGMATRLVIQHQAEVKLRVENQFQQQQIEQWKMDNANFSNRPTPGNNAQSRPNDQFNELLKLRAEVTQLKATAAEKENTPTDPMESAAKALAARVNQLKQLKEQMPDKKIPELQYLTDSDWLAVAAKDAQLNSEADERKALSDLRRIAKGHFGRLLGSALDNYLKANHGQLPTDTAELAPYFEPSVDPALLERYKMLGTGNISDAPPFGDAGQVVIGEKAPVDTDYDSHFYIGQNGREADWGTGINEAGDPDPSWVNGH
jgi:hypothetical protein